jgi:hypothetical protein
MLLVIDQPTQRNIAENLHFHLMFRFERREIVDSSAVTEAPFTHTMETGCILMYLLFQRCTKFSKNRGATSKF